MRTTIDIPDSLMARVKERLHRGNLTFRSVVISALEKSLEEESRPFKLRDASVGEKEGEPVTSAQINSAIKELQEPRLSS